MSNQKSFNHKKTNGRINREGRTVASVLFSILGTLIIAGVLITCIPAAVPRLFGYEVFNIVSGSMEPELSVGSAVYVKTCPAEDYQLGDVIAFYVNDSIMVHRLIAIDESAQEFRTKGDANASEDMNPIPYAHVIGRMEFKLPTIGKLMVLYSTLMGKIYVICFLFAGILFHMISSMLTSMKQLQIEKMKQEQQKKNDPVEELVLQAEKSLNEDIPKNIVLPEDAVFIKKRKAYHFTKVLIVVFSLAFFAVIGLIMKAWYPYFQAKKNYQKASNEFVQSTSVYDKEKKSVEASLEELENRCPISVDFQALQEINSEVVGWIYCEGTVINYPICRGGNDEYYLKHAYDHSEIKSGCIFMETENAGDFSDSNTIIYGHHMKDGSMFASLSDWAKQDYYEEHPDMWLLTPEGNYRIELFSGYITDAASETYTVFQKPGTELVQYIRNAMKKSDFRIGENDYWRNMSEEDLQKEQYIVLSTCDYTFENARYVLHGRLVLTE